MRIPIVWLIAALIALLLAFVLTMMLLPGGQETASQGQPGPIVQSPAQAAN